ncbi:probable BOI-related E3 ubiquitin-protein ligase 2 [Coffea eugenioides]|uniref:Probable BOI-related E3 ubiquitin-protein ligase 2 n=1 Tax=Coffea arabica TaxID=13443 RepID=A0A6P6UWV6_COFAR|nr:probable BOI-related E3 ubiquitin-protein ligase 2 [Coffea arabica]XP_027148571.1 probable BOI-related E3 ubiquitin-protein ligase 2 [Coffea eugenioides]
MAFPHHHFQQHHHHLQQPPPKQQQSLRDIYSNMEAAQISPPVAFFNGMNLPDQSNHPPYVPPFQVVGLAPATVEEQGGGLELQWNYGFEPKKKRPKEQDFLDNNHHNNNNNNSQMSSVDFLQARSVSTGLGLSLDNTNNNNTNNKTWLASSGDSAFLGIVGDELDLEFHRQDAEIERFLKIQGDRLRQAILEKVQTNQLQTISYVEEKVLQKLREKEAEVEDINKKNIELELRMEQLSLEANAWQQRAQYNENMVKTLTLNIQQVFAQSRDSKEGCGDSEVDDTASCCNGRTLDFHLLRKDGNEMKDLMNCKVCRVNEVCMLLLPCKHLCLCKDCESKVSVCPLCRCAKQVGMQVFM